VLFSDNKSQYVNLSIIFIFSTQNTYRHNTLLSITRYDLQFVDQCYYSVDQIKKDEMGGVCGTCGKQGRCIAGFGGET
jgi:tryptophanase